MFKKWIEKLSNNIKEDEEAIEFKNYVEEKEEVATFPEIKREEPSLPAAKDDANIELKVVRPESMEEVFTVADYLIDGITVVLNLELLDKDVIKRMLDFLKGVIYTTDSEMENVSPNTYILTPSGINVEK